MRNLAWPLRVAYANHVVASVYVIWGLFILFGLLIITACAHKPMNGGVITQTRALEKWVKGRFANKRYEY